jgi:hypothetical protein
VTCETDDGSRSEVSGTSRLTLVSRLTSHVPLFPPVSPVSLESGIGDCSRSVHE